MFKTMSARIRGSSTELAELGEEEDEFTKSTSKLRDLVKGLTGFDILEDENTYKDIFEIILGIGEEWENLTDMERASLTEALGGKRGVNTLSAVLNNVQMLKDAYAEAEGAEGSAGEELEHYSEGLEWSIGRAKASLEELANDFLSSNLLKGLIEWGNTLLRILDNIVETFGSVGSIGMAAFGMSTAKAAVGADSAVGFLTQFIAGARGAETSDSFLQNLKGAILGASAEDAMKEAGKNAGEATIKGAKEAMAEKAPEIFPFENLVPKAATTGVGKEIAENVTEGVGEVVAEGAGRAVVQGVESAGAAGGAAAESVGGSIGAKLVAGIVGALGPIGAAIAAAVAAAAVIGGGVYLYNKHEKAERQKQSSAAAEDWETAKGSLERYVASYRSLHEQMTDANNSEAETYQYKEQIYALQQEIVSAYGEQAAGIDLINGDLEQQSDLIEQIGDKIRGNNILQNKEAFRDAKNEMQGHHKREYGYLGQLPGSADVGVGKEIAEIANEFDSISFMQNRETLSFHIDADVNNAISDIDKFGQKLIELRDQYDEGSFEYNKIQGIIDSATNSQKAALDIADKFGAQYEMAMLDEVEEGQKQLVSRYAEAVTKYNKALALGDKEAVDEASQVFAEAEADRQNFLSQDNNKDIYGFLFDDYKLDETAKRNYDLKEVLPIAEQYSGIADGVSDIQSEMENSISPQNQYRDNIVDITTSLSKLKNLNMDKVDFLSQFDSILNSDGNFTDIEQAIMDVGHAFGIAFNNTEDAKHQFDGLATTLSNFGYLYSGVEDEVSKSSVSIAEFASSITSEITKLDGVNAALVNNFKSSGLSVAWDEETGKITGDVANIRDAYGDLAGYNEAKLFTRMSTGVKLNVEELRRLRKEQELINKEAFAKQQTDLTNKLAEAYRNLSNAATDAERKAALDNALDIEAKIRDAKMLESQYDAQTSAYQKWLDAQSAGEQGDIYDNLRSTAITRGDELLNKRLVGTEEFRAIAELVSGQDLSTASLQAVIDAYQGIDTVVEGTSYKLRDFFTEGQEGTDKFGEAMVELGIATKDANDYIHFENLNIDEVAEKFGTSTDVIESIFGKMKDYGWNITWFDSDTLAQLNEADSKITSIGEKMAAANKGAKTQVQSSLFDTSNLTTVDAISDRINTVQGMLNHTTQMNIDPTQAELLGQLLDELIRKKQLLEVGDGGTNPYSLESLTTTKTAFDQLLEKAQEVQYYQNMDFEVDIEGDEQLQQLVDYLANQPEDVQVKFGIEAGATSEQIMQSILDGTFVQKANQAAAAAGKVSASASKTKQPTQTTEKKEVLKQEKKITETKTKKDINETENITKNSETTEVNVETNGTEEATQELEGVKREADEGATLSVDADTAPVEDANSSIDSVEGKDVNINIHADVFPAVRAKNAIQEVPTSWNSTITLNASTAITSANNLATAIKNIPANKIVTVTYKQSGKPSVNGTAHSYGTAISNFGGSAFAKGDWRTKKSETALVGELGPEILVRGDTGTWETIGDSGAEFARIPKGSIIFNHKQTEQLLKNGYVTGRGKMVGGNALASGTAYAGYVSGGSPTFVIKQATVVSDAKTVSSSTHDNGKSRIGKTPAKNAKETNKQNLDPTAFDWIERLLENLNTQLEKFKSLGELYTKYTAQNKELDSAIKTAQKLVDANTHAATRYMVNAERFFRGYTYTDEAGKERMLFNSNNKKAGVNKRVKWKGYNVYGDKTVKHYMKLVQSGKLQRDPYTGKLTNNDIQKIGDKNLAEAIQEYMDLYDKATQAKQAVIDNRIELQELARQKLDNIIDDYDKVVEKAQALYDLNQENYTLLKNTKSTSSGGKTVQPKAFNANIEAQIKNQETIVKQREKERQALEKEYKARVKLDKINKKNQFKKDGSSKTTGRLLSDDDRKQYEIDLLNIQKEEVAANNQLNELYKQQRDLIKELHDSTISYHQSQVDYNNSQYEALQAQKGILNSDNEVSKKYYDYLNEERSRTTSIINENKASAKAYYDEIKRQINNGRLTKGSEPWKEAMSTYYAMLQAEQEANVQLANLRDKIRELNWASFNNAIEILGHLNTQLESTLSLFSDLNAFNEKGTVTKSGIAQYNLLAEQINVAKQETADYKYAIKQLGEEKKKGLITEEQYQKALRENQENMLKSANNVKKYRDSVLSLIKDGIQKETEHLKELIDTRKEALKRQKDADDYAKTVAQKSKDIQKTQAQIAAMAGDTTLATQAKVKQLREQLAQQEEELTKTRQDHAYDIYTQGLDDETTALEKAQKERITELESDLAKQNEAIKDALDTSQKQYENTYSFLSTIAKQYGIKLEEDITNPWKKGSDAANEYKKAVSKIPKNNATIATDLNGGYTDKKDSSSSKKTTSTSKKSTAKKKNPTQQAKEKLNNARNALKNAQKTVLAKQDAFNSAKSKYGASSEQAKKANAAITTAQANLKTKTTAYNSAVSNAAKYGINTKESAETVKNTAALERAEALQKTANEQRKKANENLQTAQVKLEKSISSMKALEAKISDLKATLKVAKSNNDSETVEATQKKLTAAQNSLTNAKAKINNATDGVNQAKQKVTNAAVSATNKKAAVNRATDNLAYSKEKDNQKAKTDAKNAINTGKARSKKLSAADKKLSALDQYIIQKYGRTPTNAIDKKIAKALGISTSTTMTAKQKTATLNAMKKLGLRSGAYRAGGGWRLTDEDGIGSEAILTKEGVLRQLDARDTVFNAKQRQALWDLSKMDVPSLLSDIKAASLSRAGGDVRIENHYDSLLTVNGNVDRNALPELQEILRKSYEYTTKQMHSDFKKHIGGR